MQACKFLTIHCYHYTEILMSIITRKFKLGLVATALAMTAVVSVSYAFAASNTVSDSKAGEGTSVVSGYTISGISYTLNATTPTTLDQVEFDVNNAPPAGSVQKAQLVSPAGTWYSCTVSASTHITCITTGLTVSSINELNVVIADH